MWTWRYLADDESHVEVAQPAQEDFTNQSDAESWLGENWRELREGGASQVELLDDDRIEYRMPLTTET